MNDEMCEALVNKPCPKCGAETSYGIGEEPYPCNVCRDADELAALRNRLAEFEQHEYQTHEITDSCFRLLGKRPGAVSELPLAISAILGVVKSLPKCEWSDKGECQRFATHRIYGGSRLLCDEHATEQNRILRMFPTASPLPYRVALLALEQRHE